MAGHTVEYSAVAGGGAGDGLVDDYLDVLACREVQIWIPQPQHTLNQLFSLVEHKLAPKLAPVAPVTARFKVMAMS